MDDFLIWACFIAFFVFAAMFLVWFGVFVVMDIVARVGGCRTFGIGGV